MGRAAAEERTAAAPRVLFLCTGNSCRSQMAEGFARVLLGYDAHSAGTQPSPRGIDQRAVAAMHEMGIDISWGLSKGIDELPRVHFDLVVTVCDSARETCPVFQGATRVVHESFDDPPRLAANARTDAEAMTHYRRVRDEVKAFISTLPALIAHTH